MSVKYLIKKVVYAISILWGIITLVFLLFNALPGDPSRLTLGQRNDSATIANVRHELNLDKPLFTRYCLYLNDISPISINTVDDVNKAKYRFVELISFTNHKSLVIKKPYLGRSYQTKRLVWDVLADVLPGTIILAITAIIIATIFGIGLGVLAALKRGTWLDSSSLLASVIGISAPSFFAGLIIAYIFGFLLQNYTGLSMVGSLWEYDINGVKHLALHNLILPAITLGIRPMAIIMQLTRSSLLDVLSQDYIRTAYAKGLTKAQVVWRHALPNALNPVVTAISGWLAELLAGSFFVEYVFSWVGLGKLTVYALGLFDFPVVMGGIIFTATIFVLVNMFTDILYAKLDPRVKLR